MKNRYVLIYCEGSINRQFILIKKEKPAWQKGRLNLPGGKVEEGETAQQAAERELKGEANVDSSLRHRGVFKGEDFYIDCFNGITYNDAELKGDGVEEVKWYWWDQAKNDPKLIPNLRLLIPLLRTDVSGWEVEEITDTSFKVTLC